MRLLLKINKGDIVNLIVSLPLFTFPFTSAIIAFFKLNSTLVNFLLRLLVVSLVLFLIFNKKKFSLPKLNRLQLLIVFFLVIYTIRIVFDITVMGVRPESGSIFSVYSVYFGNIILPVFVLLLYKNTLELIKPKLIFIFLILSCLGVSFLVFSKGGGVEAFLLRNVLISENSGEEVAILNPITISLHGELLAILSALLLTESNREKKYLKWVYFFGLILGIIVLFLGASRGPIVGFVFCCMLIYFLKLKDSKKKFQYILLTIGTVFSLIFILQKSFDLDSFVFLQREYSFASDEVRSELYSWLLADFLKSPIIGNQFVLSQNGWYPHNIYMESFMALGVIGGLLFMVIIFKALYKSILIFTNGVKQYYYLAFFLIMYIIMGITSSSLYGNYYFWIWIMYFSSFSLKREPNK